MTTGPDPFLPPPLPLPDAAAPSSTGPHATAVLAWCVIGLIAMSFVGLSLARTLREGRVAPAAVAMTSPASIDVQTTLTGQSVVALHTLSPDDAGRALKAMTDLTAKTPEARVAAAVVAGEIEGPAAALERLRQIASPDAAAFARFYDAAVESDAPATVPSSPDAASPGAATRPLASPFAGTPPEEIASPATAPASASSDGTSLRDRYGWFADLAASAGRPDTEPARAAVLARARKTLAVLSTAMTILVAAVVLGGVLFVTAVVLIALGRLRFRVGRPAGPSHVYVEAFAVYLGGFVALSLALGLIGGTPLWVHLVVQGGLVVLAALWPKLRGVPWATQRADWGVHTGRGVVVEILAGLGGYVAGLPVVAVGFAVTLLLLRLSGAGAAHPITNEVAGHPWLVLGLASVFAPLTEELLFRGALVSHLRAGVGVVLAAVISGVVFASVHPQGWAAVPVLASIGAVLALIRQWRGSLIGSITAHALNNTAVMLLVLMTQ